jgi:TonB family protein
LKERESAADDLVLSGGVRASDYASLLLEITRSMQSKNAVACAGVAMARRSQLEGRLVAILDAGVSRKSTRRASALAAAAAAIALCAPMAAVRAQDPQAALPPDVDATIRAAYAQKNHEMVDAAAAAFAGQKDYAMAEKLLEAGLAIRAAASGENSKEYAAGLVKLGDLEADRNKADQAIRYYSKAVALGDSPEVARALIYLGLHVKLIWSDELPGAQLSALITAPPPPPPPPPPPAAAPPKVRRASSAPPPAGSSPAGRPPVSGSRNQSEQPSAQDYFQRAMAVAPTSQEEGLAMTWLALAESRDPAMESQAEAHFRTAIGLQSANSAGEADTLNLFARFLDEHDRASEAKEFSARAAEIVKSMIGQAGEGSQVTYAELFHTTPSAATSSPAAVTAPKLLRKVEPQYTEEARAAKYSGVVVLQVVIGPDGQAHNFKLVKSLGLGLDQKAVEAVRQWHFQPGTKNGEAVPVAATVEVNFRLL